MAKTGPLGKAESFYVEEKYKCGNTIDQIAIDLDRAVSTIEKYLQKHKIKPKNSKTIIEEQFVYQKGSTIMTENASAMIEQSKKPIKQNSNTCITKIKNHE
jgi:hypothetical protein